MTNREEFCKKFTELTGGHWHENPKPEYYDGKLGGRCKIMRDFNPDYENPADVLKVIKAFLNEDDFVKFARTVGADYPIWGTIYIELKYIIEPDALLKAAVEFLEVWAEKHGIKEEANIELVTDAEVLARKFHNYYESLSSQFGYETRKDTRDFDKNSPNGKLMIEVCKNILEDKDIFNQEVWAEKHGILQFPKTSKRERNGK